ncbi:hypothetical protein METH_21890 (plasmid) [Leisingera methylohalidivorans DSM 14336]|uniref:Uncharacterized protein n=1 Tax=Leisingera methylohalidivorans DSM 14336 TaxID=999552 RepID=V9VXL3_9RHOB|nr:hypothetical protein METH_21890 [Leisingera methylohalidivorans DSM 14336]
MSGHGYEAGRLNLAFSGIATFGKKPYVEDRDNISADVAIPGAPFDFGCQFRFSARFGPQAVREASTLFSSGRAGASDHEDDATYRGDNVRIVDLGGADIIHTKTEESHANIEHGVKKDLQGLATRGEVAGIDLVAAAPTVSFWSEILRGARGAGPSLLPLQQGLRSQRFSNPSANARAAVTAAGSGSAPGSRGKFLRPGAAFLHRLADLQRVTAALHEIQDPRAGAGLIG